jgi:hypothetical protein
MLALPLLLLLAADPARPPAPSKPPAPQPVVPGPGWFKPAEVEKGCVAAGIVMPPGISGSGGVTVKFVIWPDGSADRVELPSVVPPFVAEAITTAVKGCLFTPGRSPDGKRAAVFASLPLRFVDQPGAAPEPVPESAPAEFTSVPVAPAPEAGAPPREAKAGCIKNQLHYRFPPNRLLHGELAVQVAVSAEGKQGAFQFPPDLPDDVVNAFRLSIEDCTLTPATAPDGKPTAGTFEYRVNFAQPGEAERLAGTGPRLKREARLASISCLQRIRKGGVTGHVVAQVQVKADGEPTNFRLQPENLPAETRLHVFDVLATCKWEPALGLDDKPVAADAVVTIRFK